MCFVGRAGVWRLVLRWLALDSEEKDPSIITDAPAIPGYTILSQLGEGGMATVFLAIQESFGRKVALKVLMPKGQQDSSFNERFAREARIVARLSHPNIIPVYDVGQIGDYHYISMEYLNGKDLSGRIRRGMKVGEIIRVTRDIALALDFAHRKGYVHRDVKPDNILFREDGAAVLTDFGIARPAAPDSNMTQVGKVIGTPKYMSPEQTKGEEVNSTCDLYALGVMLYEMLTGKVPFDGRDPFDIGIKHLKEPVPRLPANMAVFQPLVDGLLAKNRSKRIQSGREVVEMLDHIHQTLVKRAQARKKGQSVQNAHTTGGDGKSRSRPSAQQASESPSPGSLRADASDRAVPPPPSDTGTQGGNGGGRSRVPLVLLVLLLVLGGAGAAIWYAPQYAEDTPLVTAHDMLRDLLNMEPRVDPVQQAIDKHLADAEVAMAMGQYIEPFDGSALDLYRQVLELDPGSKQARLGLAAIAKKLVEQAEEATGAGEFDKAHALLDEAEAISANIPGLMAARTALEREEQAVIDARKQAELDAKRQAEEAARRKAEAERLAAERARQRELEARRAAEEKARQAELEKQREAERLRQEELARQKAEEEAAAAAMFKNVRIRGLLAKADTHFTRGEYYQPADENALDAYVEVLSLNPESLAAKAGIEKTIDRIIPELESMLQAQQANEARQLYEKLLQKAPGSDRLRDYGLSKGW